MAEKKQGGNARFRLAKFITVSTRRTEYAVHEDDMQGREDKGDCQVLYILAAAKGTKEKAPGKPHNGAAKKNQRQALGKKTDKAVERKF